MSHDQVQKVPGSFPPQEAGSRRGEAQFACEQCGSAADAASECCGSRRKKLCRCGSRAWAEHCCKK